MQASPNAFRNNSSLRVTPTLMNIDNLSLQSLGKLNRGVGVTELRDALEGRSSMSNPALVPRPSSVKTFEHTTPEGHESLRHSVSVRSAGTRRVVSAATRQKKKVPGAPRDVKDALDSLGIGSPKMNKGTLRSLSRSPLNKPESPCAAIFRRCATD
jgi:hypothetical protein